MIHAKIRVKEGVKMRYTENGPKFCVTIAGKNMHEYREIVDVFNNIFPVEIEKAYVELANSLKKYSVAVNRIGSNNSVIISSATSVGKSRETTQAIQDKEKNALQHLKELLNKVSDKEQLSPSEWQEIANLTNEGLNQSKQHEKASRNLSFNTNVYENSSIEMMDRRQELAEIIEELKNGIREILKLDINGEKRIDRIQMTERHSNQIDAISNLSEKNKEIWKRALSAYTTMRVNAFKQVEQMAVQAVETYHKREIINYDNQSYDYKVTMKALEFDEEQLREIYGRSLSSNSDVILAEKKIDIMELAGQYLEGKDLTEEQFRQVYEPSPDIIVGSEVFLLYDLESAQFDRNNKKTKPRH